MLQLRFETSIIYWRGPSPFYFAPVPPEESRQIAAIASKVTYGWGVIPVEATVGEATFFTSLFPKDGAYLLPLKVAIRKSMGDVDDQHLQVAMTVGARPPS
jgi:hypothetical protein